ncbi:SAM-dependent methyltransferase [Chitinophagaceae bacterium LB-8]|uniref:SAM-dependent methyltransferase n=1 Tax=Paraflavisolibacter caeni TaxID=2982496 RepID=A0A9X3B9U9_9BACT|nr:class I SAM-dependent methyltransferase [Paraflavisolibacter caeni]MCU7551781.1 SAM-dependent methyltransferase [Paraflavisolibacter caeni]
MEATIDKSIAQKLRGGYYTPKAITEFICKWAITIPTQKVLEPSCGDGNFVESAIKRFLDLGVEEKNLFGLVKGIELIEEEAIKSKQRAAIFGLNSTTIINSDFFNYLLSYAEEKYDVVVGNPPFIRYQNFPEEHRSKAFEMMESLGLKPNKLTNIWVPFLVLSANSLNENGKLGMVIPAELFQVKYAAETRIFLSNFFDRITIVTFKKLVFDDIQQEVVLLLCEKGVAERQGIRVVELNTLNDLQTLEITEIHNTEVKTLEHNSEKWTKYFLDEPEIQLLRRIKADTRISTCGEVMDVDVGIVTGRNEFFMMSKEDVEKWKLQPYTQKVVSKSNHLRGVVFNDNDFQTNSEAQHDGYLFIPPNEDFDKLPQACKEYIKYGEGLEYNTGYKCRIRKRWYITPSLWSPDAFALRQVADYPKIIINKAGSSSTDTIHRVRLRAGIEPEIVAASFLNSLSFAFSEILGRSYGGGVLTFEPTEIEEIPLPLLVYDSIDFRQIDLLIREKRIIEVLDIVDKELLIKQLGLSDVEVRMLRGIWQKLSNRRLNRK